MRFTLNFDMDNAAFEDDDGFDEAARIVREIAIKLQHGNPAGKCVDVNGNVVGEYSIIGKRKEVK